MATPVSLTLANARTEVRRMARDQSTVKPANQDTDINAFIERARQFYATQFPEQLVDFTTGLGLGTLSNVGTAGINFANPPAGLAFASLYFPLVVTGLLLTTNAPSGIRVPLTRVEVSEILRLQNENSTPAQPTQWAWATDTIAETAGTFYLHPIPDAIYTLDPVVAYELTPLAGDSSLVWFGLHGSYAITLLAAIFAARNAGQPKAFIDDLRTDLQMMLGGQAKRLQQALEPMLAAPAKEERR